jgi:PAS domain S-box-containing protein
LQIFQAKADETSTFAQSVIDTIREPLLSLDQDLRVVTLSRSFCEFFKVKPEETIGQLVYDLGNKQWDIPKLRELLEEILPLKTSFDDYEVEHDFATIGRRTMLLNARQISQEAGGRRTILLAMEDITERKEIERANKALLDRNNLILKEVHHRIKNSMNTLRSLLQLQADCMSDPGAIAALADTDGRLVSMMTLYDKLYRSVEYNDLSIKEYLHTLVDEVLANFPKAGLIKVQKELDDFRLNGRVMQSIGIIVTELLTNIIKYAFKGRETGLIRVSASLDGNLATISVADDGTGVPESVNFDSSPGFGLMLVRTMTDQIGGTITMDRTNGTIVTIAFKV